MKIAVTGATGFIGQHLIAELEKQSVEIVAVVRPNHPKIKRPFLKTAQVVQFDLHQAPTDAFKLIGCPDAVIHLAWEGLPNYDSLHHFESELPSHYQFLKNLVHSGLKQIIVTGTCFEYGMQSGLLHEDLETQPNNPYGFAKDALRRQLEYLKVDYPYKLTWARLFYLYGDGQAKNSLYPQLQKAVERGDKVFNMSKGEQLRDYLPINEVVKTLAKITKKKQDTGILNICSGKPISIRGLVEDWILENNWKIELNLGYYPYSDIEPLAFWGSRCKLDKFLIN